MFPKKIGDKCHFNYQCIDFDKNSECYKNYGIHICKCKTSYTFSSIGGKCKEFVPTLPYHTRSFDTETLQRYQTNSDSGWNIVSVVFIIIVLGICKVVDRGRDDSGQESQREENSDNNRSILRRPAERYANRPWNQRRNTFDIIQLSPNVEITNQQNFVALPLPLPENSFDTLPDDSLPPPYPDELPTYEEAMDMSAVRK